MLEDRRLLTSLSLVSATVEPDGRSLQVIFTAPLPAQYSAPDWMPGSAAGVSLKTNSGVTLEQLGTYVTTTATNITWTADYLIDDPTDVVTFGTANVSLSAGAGLLQDSSGNSTAAFAAVPVINNSLVDSNGFTTQSFQRGTGGVTIYVSSTYGSDSYSFAQAQNPATPYKTLADALNQVFSNGQNGKGADIRLLQGDTFASGGQIRTGGQDPQHPFIIEDYWYAYTPGAADPGTRPIVSINESSSTSPNYALFTSLGGSSPATLSNVVIRNIDFEATNWSASSASLGDGLFFLTPGSNWTLDNDVINNFENNLVVENGPVTHLTLLRDIITNSWNGQGVLLSSVTGALISQSTIDNNGHLNANGTGADVLLRNVYIQLTCGPALVWGNVITDNGGPDGIQMRSGGVLAYNYLGGNSIAAFIGSPGGAEYKNVVEDAQDNSASQPEGWGLAMNAAGSSSISMVIEDNLILNSAGSSAEGIGFDSTLPYGIQDAIIRHNTVVNAGNFNFNTSAQVSGTLSNTDNIYAPASGPYYVNVTLNDTSWSWYSANNNDLAGAANSSVFALMGNATTSLAGWQSLTGTEQQSITATPTFVQGSANFGTYATSLGFSGSSSFLSALTGRSMPTWGSQFDLLNLYQYYAVAFTPTNLPAAGSGPDDYYGASNYLDMKPGPTTAVVVSSNQSAIAAGLPETITVTAVDSNGNVATGYTGTVTFSSSDAQAVLPANYTFTPADNGSHTFSITLKTTGAQTITATDTAHPALAGKTSPILVSPTSAPSATFMGVNTTTEGNWKGTYGSSGYDVSQDPNPDYSTLPSYASISFTGASQYLWAASTTIPSALQRVVSGSTSGIAGAWTGSTFSIDLKLTDGQPHQLALYALDFGNAGRSERIDIISDATGATLDSEVVSNFQNGKYLVWDVSGSVTIRVTTLNGSNAVLSGIFLDPVPGSATNSGPATTMVVSNNQSAIAAGLQETITVTAVGSNGNVATGYTGTVTFSSSDAQAVLPANYTFTPADNGSHTFSVTLKTAGTQTITATDTANPALSSNTSNILVSPSSLVSPTSATAVVVSNTLSAIAAGLQETITVTAVGSNGNVATGYTGTVTFSSSDAQAVLPANYTFTPADDGSHTFSVTLETAGTQTITATDTANPALSGNTPNILVKPAPVATVVVSGPSTATAGQPQAVIVTVLDAYGNVATGYTGTVTFSSSDAQAVLPANYTFTPADNGSHTFSVTLETAGTQTITATDTANPTLSGKTSPILVSPTSVPSATFVGVNTTTEGNWKGTYGSSGYDISQDPSPDNPALPSYASISVIGASGYTWAATTTNPIALQKAASGSTAGIAGAWTGSTFSIDLKLTDGQPHQLALYALDFGNAGRSERIDIISDATGATLDSEVVSNFQNGEYLVWDVSGSVTIRVTTLNGSNAVLSGIFLDPVPGNAMNSGPATAMVVSGTLSTIVSGLPETITVTAVNSKGYVATGYTGTVTFSSSDAQAVLPASYTFTPADDGSHTFSVTLETPGTQTITVTDTAHPALSSNTSNILVIPSSSASPTSAMTAAFVGVNTTTEGNWKGTYGSSGYDISQDPSPDNPALPSYASISVIGASGYTWAATTTNPTALQKAASGSTSGIAGAWTGSTFSIDLKLTDGQPHQLALYALDFGNAGRSERIDIISDATGATLDSEVVSNFQNGEYLVWDVSSSVTIRVTTLNGSNAVLSGIFLDPVPGNAMNSGPATAMVVSSTLSTITAGLQETITVTAVNSKGNVATGYTGTVTFSSSDAQAVLPANYTFTPADDGSHTFSITLKTPGTRTITVTDTAHPALSGNVSTR